MGLFGEFMLQHDAVQHPRIIAACRGCAVGSADIDRRSHILAGPGNACDPPPITQLFVESPVPTASGATCGNAPHERPVLRDLIVAQHTSMRDRLSILHRIGRSVKEIVRRRYRLVTDWSVK